MKIFKIAMTCLFVLCSVVLLPGSFTCAGHRQEERKISAEEQKELEIWNKMTTPGKHHNHLEYFVGEWDSIQKIWSIPGSEPDVYRQYIRVESILGGRFTRAYIRFAGEVEGMVPEGYVITGYDNYKQQYVSATYSNLATNIPFMSGTLDETGKIRTDYGQEDDYLRNRTRQVKAVTTILSPDKYTYEYYHIGPEGKTVKAMEIVYRRKKSE